VPATPAAQHDAQPSSSPLATEAAPSLSVLQVDLVARSTLPPHSALASSAADAALVGLDPSGWDLEGMEGVHGSSVPHAASAGPVAGSQQQQSAQQGGQDAGEVEHVDCTAARGAQHMGSGDQGREDDDCDVDPRTLAEAAARLEAYTSAERVDALPHEQAS
jgi:hypothetical protein